MRGLRRRLGYSVRRRRQRRYSWRRNRRGAATRTRVIKFQTQINVPFQAAIVGETISGLPITFSPTDLPGFLEWQATMSEFRFLKAKLKIGINPGATADGQPADQQHTYLRVSSRQFVTTRALVYSTAGQQEYGVTNMSIRRVIAGTLADARQSKFTKQMYPSDTRNVLTTGFYPYTLQWSGKVYNASADNLPSRNTQYLEYRSARRWMSMSYLGPTASSADDVTFIGPYMYRLLANQPDTQPLTAWQPTCLLTVYAQFRGQK